MELVIGLKVSCLDGVVPFHKSTELFDTLPPEGPGRQVARFVASLGA